ncbi:type II secretion system protein [Massilia sp. H6]|uniref:type II secretion system protein n=1 Tax=Massilia sp. H6 TaxID=2970464 RepID=UPI002167CE88|nr:type II secretion system protein [Massilia sp. H6]UVW28729.1 type II secretion system GspH family protein [Massilia sp. H6]
MTARRLQRGFSYVELLVAAVVLGLCAAPLMGAIQTGVKASEIGSAKANELRCIKNVMETVLAEPYQHLWNAARGTAIASSYSRPQDAACVAREVYIALYEHEWGKTPLFLDATASAARRETAMLYITVSSPASGYAFTTLVAR